MKKLWPIIAIAIFFFSGPAFGQWNSDPNMPITVSNATGIQKGVQSFADGSGGIFTFWLDARTGNNLWDVYGQHYNADGIAQWEENGKEIVNYDGRVNTFNVLYLGNGNFMMAYSVQYSTILAENGVYVQKFNDAGAPIWPTAVKVRNDSNYTNGISRATLVESGGNFYIATQAVVIGGANNLKICKIDQNGQ